MNFKHIIWDWNGTIVNDSWLSVEVLNGLLKDFNLPQVTTQDYRENFSFPVINYYKKLGFNVSKKKFEEIGKVFIKNFNAKRFDCKLNDGVLDVIQNLYAKNIPQSILSAYEIGFLKEATDFFGVSKYMSKISGLDDINANTKLALGIKHIESLKLDPKEILVVGDTDHDFEVAKTTGANCVLMATGHQSFNRLSKTGTKVCKNYAELKSFLFE